MAAQHWNLPNLLTNTLWCSTWALRWQGEAAPRAVAVSDAIRPALLATHTPTPMLTPHPIPMVARTAAGRVQAMAPNADDVHSLAGNGPGRINLFHKKDKDPLFPA